VGFVQRHRHDDALARRQAVGLDDDGGAAAVHVGVGGGRVGEGLVGRCRDAVALHEVLGKGLGAFELGGGFRRAKDAQATRTELVDDASGQCRLRADDGQRDLVFNGEIGERGRVGGGDGHVLQSLVTRRAAVAGGHIDLADALSLGQLPGQRVFAAAVAND